MVVPSSAVTRPSYWSGLGEGPSVTLVSVPVPSPCRTASRSDPAPAIASLRRTRASPTTRPAGSARRLRRAVFDRLPSPARSHSDSTSRIDRPRTNAPITRAFNGSVRNNVGVRGNSLDANVSAAWRTCGISIASSPCLHPTGAKPVAQPRLLAARLLLTAASALIASPTQPRVKLNLNSTLDDQPSPQPGQLRQHLARVITHPNSEQLTDPGFNLRRRRYGTSHGVGLLHRLAGHRGNLRRRLDGTSESQGPLVHSPNISSRTKA
jgi:hypothetical protein